MKDFKGSQEKSWEIFREIKGKFKGYYNIPAVFLLLLM